MNTKSKSGARKKTIRKQKASEKKPASIELIVKSKNNVKSIRFPKGNLPEKTFQYHMGDDNNLLNIINVVRNGIPVHYFNQLVAAMPFDMTEWAEYLQISERTIQRNQKEKKAFQPIQSERIIELTMLYQYGIEVFGDKENFHIWLGTASIALGGRQPKELLDTKFGIEMVKDELGRIEHGILA